MKIIALSLLIAMSACKPSGPVYPVIGNAIVDCLGADRPKIDALIAEFEPLIRTGQMSWSAAYQRAKQGGLSIGGCFLGELVQAYLGGTRFATPTAEAGWEARAYFELYRKEELKGATLKTKAGNL